MSLEALNSSNQQASIVPSISKENESNCVDEQHSYCLQGKKKKQKTGTTSMKSNLTI